MKTLHGNQMLREIQELSKSSTWIQWPGKHNMFGLVNGFVIPWSFPNNLFPHGPTLDPQKVHLTSSNHIPLPVLKRLPISRNFSFEELGSAQWWPPTNEWARWSTPTETQGAAISPPASLTNAFHCLKQWSIKRSKINHDTSNMCFWFKLQATGSWHATNPGSSRKHPGSQNLLVSHCFVHRGSFLFSEFS